MTPLLTGVFASQISGHLTPPFTLTGNYDALSTVIVPSGGLSSITFAGIPQTGYSHLQIRGIWKNNTSATDIAFVELKVNGSSTGYSYHILRGDGSSASAAGSASLDRTYPAQSLPSNNASYANMFGTGIIDILDYVNTNKNKTIRTLFGFDGNGSGRVGLSSGLWQNTNAITSIELKDQNAGSFVQYSQFALYGVKA